MLEGGVTFGRVAEDAVEVEEVRTGTIGRQYLGIMQTVNARRTSRIG